MNKYELLVIFKNELDDAGKEALVEKVTNIVSSNNGNVTKTDIWGTKKYAYPIDYKTEGYYVLFDLEAPATTPREVEKLLNLTENVVRCMFSRK